MGTTNERKKVTVTPFVTVTFFETTNNCAIITYGKHTLKVGPIKNTNSGWNSDGRFSWGSAPTLLKN